MAELGSCDREHRACETYNIYYLTLYRKRLLTLSCVFYRVLGMTEHVFLNSGVSAPTIDLPESLCMKEGVKMNSGIHNQVSWIKTATAK